MLFRNLLPNTYDPVKVMEGNGRSNIAFTVLNIMVFAPMPKASVKAATTVTPGLLRNWRSAKRRSWNSLFIVSFSLVPSYS